MSPCEETGVAPKARRKQTVSVQSAWEELIQGYGPLVRGQVGRSLRNAGILPEPEQVAEREQEVYYRLLSGGTRRLRLLQRWNEGQVVSYLSKVARRVVFDEMRAQAAVKRGGGFRLSFVGRSCEIADLAVDLRACPEQEALRRERQRLLFARCQSLVDDKLAPEVRRRYVEILRRVFLEGWTGQEVVRAAGGRLAPSTVHALVHRARRRLARGERYDGRP